MHFASDITQWAPRQLKESMMRPLTVIMITIMIMTTMIMKLTHLIRISPILSSPSLTSRSCPYSGNYIKFGITQTAFMWNQNLSFSSLQNATNCGRKGPKGGPSINFHVVGGEEDAYIITPSGAQGVPCPYVKLYSQCFQHLSKLYVYTLSEVLRA